jgi:hypothetical protein
MVHGVGRVLLARSDRRKLPRRPSEKIRDLLGPRDQQRTNGCVSSRCGYPAALDFNLG